jgi:hypothetical protein
MIDKQVSEEDLPTIIAAFRAFSGLRDRARRRRCVSMAAENLCIDPGLDLSDDIAADVDAIVRIFNAHWGGLYALLAALAEFAEENHQASALYEVQRAVADRVQEPLLQPAERADLRRILWQADPPNPARLRRMYRVTAPLNPVDDQVSRLLEVLWEFDEMPSVTADVPPFLIFIDLLLHEWNGIARAERLRDWADQVAERLGLVEEHRHDLRAKALARLEAPPFLVAQIGNILEDGRIWLNIYLQWTSEELDRLHRSEHPCTLDQISPALFALLRDHAELRDDRLVIEFVLPEQMINYPFDEFELGDPPHQIGRAYPVVVRLSDSWQRLDASGKTSSYNKWLWLRQHGHEVHPEAVYWKPGADGPRHWAELVDRAERVCVVLPQAPESDAGALERLRQVLSAGVPVLVWSRTENLPPRIESELIEKLRTTPVRDHVQVVRDLRLDSQRKGPDASHVGEHLTIYRADLGRSIPPGETHFVNPLAPA